ncbi:MAG TPA: glycosyl hydrolase, partial [Rhodothermales bacterium]|nr:glycosyl hydrolase [Rhodothermales bacterium]
SGDLTGGPRRGDVPWGTLTTVDESPLRFGLLYTGSDDGLIHVSQDGGYTWQRIDTGLPQGLYVSRVEASRHAAGRVYVTLNGYRYDHMEPYVYVSDDYGQS